jgi:hypothetical protein
MERTPRLHPSVGEPSSALLPCLLWPLTRIPTRVLCIALASDKGDKNLRVFGKKNKIKLELISELGGFDVEWYKYVNVDVAESGQDPLEHYLTIGWLEGRNPNPYFSTRGYLEANPDVAAAGCNPLVHFWNYGMAEGRNGWQILIKPMGRAHG